jgi:transcriptional regulator with XRE-family HTH domain
MAAKSVKEWMDERGLTIDQLAEKARVDSRAVRHLVAGQWTASAEQRRRIAEAVGVAVADIRWGHSTPVDHMYGHGPQFGRSP